MSDAATQARIEEFQGHWKRLWSIAEPWLLADVPHKIPPLSPDEEHSFRMEREWIGRNVLAVALDVGRDKERSGRFARGVRQLLDLSTSLADLAGNEAKRANFRAQWNHTYNRLSVAVSRYAPGANRRRLLEQEAALYPPGEEAPARRPGPLARLFALLVGLLALWKAADLAYVAWRMSTHDCAVIGDPDEVAAEKADCLPGFFPFYPWPED